ncbi:hypothetical protein VCV18_011333 [Metarhizium anisopliae]|nr:hypothetical protein H633G_01317 [Metarhizium anisopliae BRIP 53284]
MQRRVDERQQSVKICSCVGQMGEIRNRLQHTPQDVTNILDQAEQLADAYWKSSGCTEVCRHSALYINAILDCVNRLLVCLDAIWSAIKYDDPMTTTTLSSSSMAATAAEHFQLHLPRSGRFEPAATSIISGHQSTASINQYILSDSERDSLLQELLRETTMLINKILEDVRSQVLRTSALGTTPCQSTDFEGLADLCSSQLERTYAALARYRDTTRSRPDASVTNNS